MTLRATVVLVGDVPSSVIDELAIGEGQYVLLQTDAEGVKEFAPHVLQEVDVSVLPAEEGLVQEGPTFDRARLDSIGREDWRVELVVPFPNGRPTCALCTKEEVTHVAMFTIEKDGESGSAFGGVCDECAQPYVAEVEPMPGAN